MTTGKRLITTMILASILAATFAAGAFGSQSDPESVQAPEVTERRITFQSGPFSVAGYLRVPEGKGPHPLLIFIHRDGPTNYSSAGYYLPIWERVARAGYATFSWDKPGSGDSTGKLDIEHLFENRAQIAVDALPVLREQPDIDAARIGLWGGSQAGYVIPLILAASSDIQFLIADSCPGEASIDQWAYLIASQARCEGVPAREAELLDASISGARRARTYDEYLFHKGVIARYSVPLEKLGYKRDLNILPEEQWKPGAPGGRAFFDPMPMMESLRIPVLAIYGEKDTQVDPLQGMQAYKRIRDIADNPDFTIRLITGVDHAMIESETGCKTERMSRTAEEWANISSEYLDAIENWLRSLELQSTP